MEGFDEFWEAALDKEGNPKESEVERILKERLKSSGEDIYDRRVRVPLEEATTVPAKISQFRDVLMPQYRTPENERLGWIAGHRGVTRYIDLLHTIPELGIQEEVVIHLHPQGELLPDGEQRIWNEFSMAFATHQYACDKSRMVRTQIAKTHELPSGEKIDGIFSHLPYIAETIERAVIWAKKRGEIPSELKTAYRFIDHIRMMSLKPN